MLSFAPNNAVPRQRSGLGRALSDGAAAWAVLALGLVLSIIAGKISLQLSQEEQREEFQGLIMPARAAVESRVRAYVEALDGLQSLFVATDTVDRRMFRRYVANLDLPARFPGIKALAFARRVRAADVADFEKEVRRDRSVDPRGYPNFALRPRTARDEHFVIEYAEPEADNLHLLGRDLAAEPGRLSAIERARDPDAATATGWANLLADGERGADLELQLPLYRNHRPHLTAGQRREDLVGLLAAVIRVEEMFQGLLGAQVLEQVRLRVYDLGPANAREARRDPIFDSLKGSAAIPAANRDDAPSFDENLGIDVGGRRWELRFTAREGLQRDIGVAFPWIVMLGGIVTSLLVAGLFRSLSATRRRAAELAEQMTAELRASQLTLAEAQHIAHLGSWSLDPASGRIDWSEETTRLLGFGPTAAASAYFRCLRRVHRIDRSSFHALVRSAVRSGQGFETEFRTIDADHRICWLNLVALPMVNERAEVCLVRGTVMDITARKRAELRQAMEHAVSRLLANARSIGEATPQIIESLCTIMGWDCGARWSLDRERQLLECGETWSVAISKIEDFMGCTRSGSFVPGRNGLLRRAVESGEPHWIADIAREERSARAVSAHGSGLKGAVALPLSAGDEILGVMEFFYRDRCEIDAGLMGILGSIGSQIGQFWQRRQAEEGLRSSEARLHGIVHLAIEAIVTVDEDFNVVLFNPAAEKMFGCSASEAIGTCFERFIPPGQRDLHRRHMQRFSETGETVRRMGDSLQVTGVRAGGEEFPVEASISKMTQNGKRLYTVILHDISARRRNEEQLEFLANYDSLTSLPNRGLFNQRLRRALTYAQRYNKGLAMLFIDLDRFKNINDTLGHEAGDIVLQGVAERLVECMRESDTVARLGGDEFVVLVEQIADTRFVAGVARKLVNAVAEPFMLEGQEYHITASIGISTYPPDGADGQTLLKNADIAMYRAKEQGKNNFQFYAAQMNKHTVERLTLESGLRRALERQEFLLHYQPKLEISSGRVTGMEALVRWQRPGTGMVSPAQFIPLAEETGLIVMIGEWVLKTACARNRAWQAQGMPPLRVAVNLSARQFAQASLVRDVARVLDATGLDPIALELEITESMVMGNPEQAVQTLRQLKSMGISLAIDDFGTGYSSLAYLKRFPLDRIKIDRAFIKDIPGNVDDMEITRTIIAMAHSLRLRVVAEGVETEEQYNFLRDHGCDELQGYYFSKPLAEREFFALLRRDRERVALTA